MIETAHKKLTKFISSDRIPLLVFFSSLFIFLSFAGTRIFFSDEGIILDQLYNLINGSLALEIVKINVPKGVYVYINNQIYGKFSYSLITLSFPIYYMLKSIDYFFGAHFFLLQLWAVSGGVTIYLLARIRDLKYAWQAGLISYLILIMINLNLFEPIYFPKWGELLSIEFTNILLSSFLVLMVYYFFRNFSSNRISIFASFFVVFATPISFYAITLKHHTLALLLSIMAFYFFYRYSEKKDDRFIYTAYVLAGLCIWTRTLDGVVLMVSLFLTDIVVFRRKIKYIFSVSMIILISLVPFFGFNYLILGSPFSIMELTPLLDKQVPIMKGNDFIMLESGDSHQFDSQVKLLNDLGFRWNAHIRSDWLHILSYISFSRLANTFGIFLVSPFLIVAAAFALDRIKGKIKLSPMDRLLGLYIILFILLYKNYILILVTHTPMVLEYRYLLIIYFILLYFALRVGKIRELIDEKLKTILKLYAFILVTILIYFIIEFPVPFVNLYHYASVITLISLFIFMSSGLKGSGKKAAALPDKVFIFTVALSLALSTAFLLFYYWVANMSYISPSQNHLILPVLDNIIKGMYQVIL